MNDPISRTEAEWKIMLRLWERSPRTRSLEPETGWARHTVITMLKRMRQKGTVHSCEDGPVKTYTPAADQIRVARARTERSWRASFRAGLRFWPATW